jgi:hypothetical protein
MKKALLVLVAGFVVAAITGLVGCGGTSVKVDTGQGKVEISSPQGSVKLQSNAPTEAQLGVPIYPSAKFMENSAGSYTQGQQTVAAAGFTTDDSIDKVVAWYKSKLSGKPQFTDLSTPEGGMLSFQSGSEIKSVLIAPSTEVKGKTGIVITSGTGNMQQQTQ